MARRGSVVFALLLAGLLACSGGKEDAPPSTPRNVIAGTSSSYTVEIAWSPSTDDHGVVSYDVQCYAPESGFFHVESTNETTFTDIWVGPSTQYCYTIIAIDTAGSRSPPSRQACATTAATIPLAVWKTGTGTVTSSPAGIDCGRSCGAAAASFGALSWVTLTATPEDGATFTEWLGCTSASGATCSVHMTASRAVMAVFQSPLTVIKEGSGSGTIVSSPAGIDCGGSCSAPFAEDTGVTLIAIPESGSRFTGWEGCSWSYGTECHVSMRGAAKVTAHFQLPLAVVKEGTGSGKVVSSPAGIDCGDTCAAPFAEWTHVTLTALPESGSAFAGWLGCASVNGTTCTIERPLRAPRIVTATFAIAGSITASVATTGVELDPDGYVLLWTDPAGDGSTVVPVNGTTIIAGLNPGTHELALRGVAHNCDGIFAATTTVISGATTPVSFDFLCAPPRELAFVSTVDGNPEIYLVRTNGTGLQRLTSDPASDVDPSWSPDGTRLAFASNRDGTSEIYVMEADGSNPQRLTIEPAGDRSPAWSPDGTRLAFVSERDGRPEIYVMGADGSNPTRLTTDGVPDDGFPIGGYPAWSPDGSRIAFARACAGASGAEVLQVNADGTGLRSLTGCDDIYRRDPDWSPDGVYLAWAGHYDDYWGSAWSWIEFGSRALVYGGAYCGVVRHPRWSPDARHFAYTVGDPSLCPSSRSEVWIIRSDGADPGFLIAGDTPAWRP